MTEDRFNQIMIENGFYVNDAFGYPDNTKMVIIAAYNTVSDGIEYIASLWDLSPFENNRIRFKLKPDNFTKEEDFEKAVKALGVKYRNLKKQLNKEQIKKAGEEYVIG